MNMPHEGASGRLLTVEELAERLNVPRSWVYAQTASDEIPHVHVGRYVRFSWGDVHQWLTAQSPHQ